VDATPVETKPTHPLDEEREGIRRGEHLRRYCERVPFLEQSPLEEPVGALVPWVSRSSSCIFNVCIACLADTIVAFNVFAYSGGRDDPRAAGSVSYASAEHSLGRRRTAPVSAEEASRA
jgi:hypothetical protein